MKNYAVAFQIAAAFRGNSAFVSAAQKIKELKDQYHEYGKKLEEINKLNDALFLVGHSTKDTVRKHGTSVLYFYRLFLRPDT